MKVHRRFFASSLVAIAGAGLMAGAQRVGAASPDPSPGEPTLADVRQVTERYRDVNVALKDGFIRDPFDLCDTAEMMGMPAKLGAMGVHYFRPDLLGITEPPSPRVNGAGTHTDFRNPAILIYEPQADGSMQLVAVENLVFQASWRAAGHRSRRRSTAWSTTRWPTTRTHRSTKRTCSRRTSIATCGCIAATRTACSHRSTPQ